MYTVEEIIELFDRATEAVNEYTDMVGLIMDGKIYLTDEEINDKYEEVTGIIKDSEDAINEFLSLFDQGATA